MYAAAYSQCCRFNVYVRCRSPAVIILDQVYYFEDSGNMEIRNAVSALAALAQETRLAIFRLLVEAGPDGLPVGRIGEQLKVPGATLSFHLKELARAGLVISRHQRQFIYYRVDFDQMVELMTFLTKNCCRGMPEKCLTVMETALGDCCAPVNAKSKAKKRQ